MKGNILHKALKIVMRLLAVLLLSIVVMVALLYVPAIQNWIKNIVLEQVNESMDMTVEVERLQVRFPINIETEGVRVLDAGGDTMVSAESLSAHVNLWPLMGGDISVGDVALSDAFYRMGTPDSVMYMLARLGKATIDEAGVSLNRSLVMVGDMMLSGGEVMMSLKTDTATERVDTATTMPWRVLARRVSLNRMGFQMNMENVADRISANISTAELNGGEVDLSQTPPEVKAGSFELRGDDVEYLTDTLIERQAGLDLNRLCFGNVAVRVDSLYNRGVNVIVPYTTLHAEESCGVKVDCNGVFEMDSVAMRFDDVELATLFSQIKLAGSLGLDGEDSPVAIAADARIGLADVEMMYPLLKPMLTELPRYNGLIVRGNVDGRLSSLNLNELLVELPRYMKIEASGDLKNVTDFSQMSGNINIAGNLNNVNFVKPSVLDARLRKQVNIPPLTLDGGVVMIPGEISGRLTAVTGSGRLALDAQWEGDVERYDLSVALDSFPVTAFFPEMGLGELCAEVKASGVGFDVFSPAMVLNADVALKKMIYNGRTYGNARAWASLIDGRAQAGIVSLNDNADFDAEVTAEINEDKQINWAIDGDVRNFDMRALGLSTERMQGALSLSGTGEVAMQPMKCAGHINVGSLEWIMGDMSVTTSSLDISAEADDSVITAQIVNNDLNAEFSAECGIDTFATRLSASMDELIRQMEDRRIDVERFQTLLPKFAFKMNAGSNNVLNSYLSSNNMTARNVSVVMSNDSLIDVQGKIAVLKMGESRIDTLTFDVLQHSRYLIYNARMNNRPGTMDRFAKVELSGYLADDKVSAFVKQRNAAGREGFNFGVVSSIGDSTVSIRFSPLTPVIGYKNWTINSDNFITYGIYTHHFDANLKMESDDSHIQLYTRHDKTTGHQEDVVLNVANLKISELLSVSPYAPPMKGTLSADMRFGWNENSLDGSGLLSINEMYYGRDRVGTFDLGVELSTTRSGVMNASASLMVDSVKTITAVGVLNDTTLSHPFNLDFRMIRFPLRVLNPFMPDNMMTFAGQLNGEMDVTGELSSPRFNGHLNFDTTSVKVKMIGSSFTFSSNQIPVEDNVVTFKDYEIWGANENPLKISGVVDMNDVISPQLNLDFEAQNMQFINSTRGKGADIYGKGFANVSAKATGDMSMLDIDANLTLLGGSNLTYVMTDAATAITSQSTGEMVKFVEFADTFEVAKADSLQSAPMAINLDARLRVSGGTTINVDLSTDGKNRVQLQGSGTLNYTMNNMDDSRFTGRYTIDKGFVKYTPPLMSEKLFNFNEGSYVAFNGDMLNPILNIHAVDEVRANVTREGQDSRLVDFDVSLSVTNTLSNMNVAFDLSTADDIGIQNELQSMSAEQRANQAMNLLLYNVYTGPGTTGGMSSNPLYSFLESQINTWAANNIKFVDISFGIDQYDKTQDGSTSSAMNYSYRVSKTLFNDRFKIVVGGNYSTEADADEDVAQSLINDISFEYMLNRSGSMYVKIFRHVGYESILEGEVTQTGVGFVYKRKLQTLRDLFRFGRRSKSVKSVPDSSNQATHENQAE